MRLTRKEEFILRKLVGRELMEARLEFFGSRYPDFGSERIAEKEMKRFDSWYRTKRRHIDGVLDKVEAFEDGEGIAMAYPDGFRFSTSSKIAEAYGLVFEATKNADYEHSNADSINICLLQEALGMDPDNEDALFRASDYFMVKDPPAAARLVDRLIEIDPKEPLAYAFKAAIMINASGASKTEIEKARDYITKAYEMEPNNFEIASTYAHISYLLRDAKGYKRLLGRLYKLDRERAERFAAHHAT